MASTPTPIPPVAWICACGRAWTYPTTCFCGRDVPDLTLGIEDELRCPVCEGTGEIRNPVHNPDDVLDGPFIECPCRHAMSTLPLERLQSPAEEA